MTTPADVAALVERLRIEAEESGYATVMTEAADALEAMAKDAERSQRGRGSDECTWEACESAASRRIMRPREGERGR
jgi:hypothetical protein